MPNSDARDYPGACAYVGTSSDFHHIATTFHQRILQHPSPI